VSIVVNVHGRMDKGPLNWLLETFGARIKDKAVVDVGANLGNHTLAFAERAGSVVALEPHPLIFQLLKLNCRGRDHVIPVNVGASDRAATVSAASRASAFGSTRITDAPEPGEEACEFLVTTLDELPELKERPVGLMKIDVEGHEEQAIRGAENLLRTQLPVVVLEQNAPVIENGTSPALELLRSFGYTHFYEPVPETANAMSERLPKSVGRLTRRAEHLLFGIPEVRWTARPLQRLEKRPHEWIVACTGPLAP
jgi:FkbM family methyltransferase